MNNKIKQHLIYYNQREGYGTDEEALINTLLTAKQKQSKITGATYGIKTTTIVEIVVEVDGMFIGYTIDHPYAFLFGEHPPQNITIDLSSVFEAVEVIEQTKNYVKKETE